MLKRGIAVIIFLVLLLAVIDSAWIFSYKKVISTEITGGKTGYTILHEFNDIPLLNTSNGSADAITILKIGDLTRNINVTFEISTTHKSLNTECSSNYTYTNDCEITIIHNGTSITENVLIDEENFTLYKYPAVNFINYKIKCAQNSCPQRINSTITFTEI